jgi:hypothetical protein
MPARLPPLDEDQCGDIDSKAAADQQHPVLPGQSEQPAICGKPIEHGGSNP